MTYRQILQRRAKKNSEGAVLWKLTPFQIIGKPIITEKAYKMVEDMNTYVFKVAQGANKNDVKLSLQKLYGVSPSSIRIMNVVAKGRMHRKLVRRAYKKAYVALKQGDKIELAG